VTSCPTWQWASGEASQLKSYLPKTKQFLITRNVPSQRRATDYAMQGAGELVVDVKESSGLLAANGAPVAGEDAGWVSTHTGMTQAEKSSNKSVALDSKAQHTVGDMDADAAAAAAAVDDGSDDGDGIGDMEDEYPDMDDGDGDMDDDDIPDMDAFEEDDLLVDDDGALQDDDANESNNNSNDNGNGNDGGDGVKIIGDAGTYLTAHEPEDLIMRTRTYDVSITYDKYYRTPRVYLFGYDENRETLSPEKIMQDVSCDHANKTVTVETHPHLLVAHASIHPCRHASVMKKIVRQISVHKKQTHDKLHGSQESKTTTTAAAKSSSSSSSGSGGSKAIAKSDGVQLNVDQYMILFLKFMSSILPTIDYDHTTSV
jgi:ubiquitin-like-conjugating enzyme ATG3